MARRFLVLALFAACEAPAPPKEPPPPQWAYAPAPSGWPIGVPERRFGRAQAPQPLASLGIAGTQKVPLRLATLWDVPDPAKSARAVAYGYEGVQPAVELIDIDAGRVVWRQTGLCTGPIVGVTDAAIVCSDGTGVRGVTLDGKSAWRAEQLFVAMTDDRVVVSSEGHAVILDATTGDELSRVKLPANVIAETVVASCGDAGRELFIAAPDRMLQRVADVKGKPVVTWRVPLGAFEAIDACEGDQVLVKANGALASYVRGTGASRASVPEVRGWWPARDGGDRIEIATASGVASWSRDLLENRVQIGAPLGELVSKRGDRRLVRATPSTMVVLDRQGVAAYVALGAQSAVLGDSAITTASYTGSRANTIERYAVPPRYSRSLRLSFPSKGVAVPTELRDLPDGPAMMLLLDPITKADTGAASVGPIAIDPATPHVVYVVAAEKPIDDETPQAIAALDLATRSWLWQRADACGPGTVKALAITADLVACGTQGTRPGTALVRATSRTGESRWEWEGDGVDGIVASRSLLVVSAGDRAFVLDASGHTRLTLPAREGAMVAAIIDTREWGELVIAAQYGMLVARAAALDMRPVWTLAIDGVATSVQSSGDGVLVQLEDGDAYRIVAHDGAVIAMPGIGLEWHTGADLLAGLVAGGPLYGAPLPPKPGIAPKLHGVGHGLLVPDDPELPDLWTPITPPPIVGAGQQLTIYEPAGGVRVRAEYELGKSSWAPRGPAGSPILLVADTPEPQVVVIDPRTATPTQRYLRTAGEVVFSTIVNGSPVVGAVIDDPLRVVILP